MANSGQQIDPMIWSACGGQATLGPQALSEKFVFFPQGLIRQCSNNEELRLLCSRLPFVGCSVVSVRYLADTITDEVYAKVVIKYERTRYNTPAPDASRPATTPASNTSSLVAPSASGPTTSPRNTRAPSASRPATSSRNAQAPDSSRPATTPASNTPSPVARGPSTQASNTRDPASSRAVTMAASNPPSPPASGLIIPQGFIRVIHADDLLSLELNIKVSSLGVDLVLPKEDVSLVVKDVHGRSWPFDHKYNHVVKTHILANGWKPFLDSKKLLSGDSLVFLKTEDGLTVGIRRAPRSSSGFFNMGEPLSRVGSGALSIVELAEILGKPYRKALSDRTLTFDYFPSVESSWFVVPAAGLMEKLKYNWRVGMQVRKLSMVKDQLILVWIHGTVTGVRVLWDRAFWKTLDVNWDQSYGQREAATNLWEVEPVVEETSQPVREEATQPVPEETTEERSSKKPCIRGERSDATLTVI